MVNMQTKAGVKQTKRGELTEEAERGRADNKRVIEFRNHGKKMWEGWILYI